MKEQGVLDYHCRYCKKTTKHRVNLSQEMSGRFVAVQCTVCGDWREIEQGDGVKRRPLATPDA